MDYLFMTAQQVWEGFIPEEEPLDIEVRRSLVDDGFSITDLYYTAEHVEGVNIRAFARLYKKAEWLADGILRPAVLVLPSVRELYLKKYVLALLDKGFVVAFADYAGECEDKEFYTQYPRMFDYGNYERAGSHLTNVQSSARDTSWYLWSKVAMRALTLLQQDENVDEEKLGLIGIAEGAQIAWQVAGVDKRLKAVVPILGAGNLEYQGKLRYSADNKIQMNDERNAWLAGVAPQTYAQSIACPLYFLTASNSAYADLDRAYDTFQMIKNDDAIMAVTPKCNMQVQERNLEAAFLWMSQIFEGTHEKRGAPELAFSNLEGKLYVKVRAPLGCDKLKVYLSEGEIDPTARNWEKIVKNAFTGDDEYLYEIPVYDTSDRVFVFASAVYSDGVIATGKMISMVPDEEGITALEKSTQYDRVIYSGTMRGASGFYAENPPEHLECGRIELSEGPGGLVGIKAATGNLVTYKLRDSEFAKEKRSLLQFSAYTALEAQIRVNLYFPDSEDVYFAEIDLAGSESWQRITLGVTDFKTEQMNTLKEWANVRKTEIVGAEGILFNNFLWL